jgi:hypothetical protein
VWLKIGTGNKTGAYSIGDIDNKRKIVGVVFPDKMEIENGVLRTGRVNEAIRYIYLMDSELLGKKKDKPEAILICPV